MIDQGSALLRLASNVRLFAGMPMTLLAKLISFSDKISISNGELFFNEGDMGESFYILIIGHVAVEQTKKGNWIQLAALHPGDSFGEMTLVDDKVRSARVRATTDCVALFFPVQRLRGSPEITSSLYQNIAKILVKRLKSSNNVVLDLTAKISSSKEPEEAVAPAAAATVPEEAKEGAPAAVVPPGAETVPTLPLRPTGRSVRY